jgi:hypothetical protein
MKNKIDLYLSFSLYSFGLLAMVLADFYVAQNFAKEDIAEWSFLKSSILITGGICLLGYDYTFVRDPTLVKRIFTRYLLQALSISLIVTLGLGYIKGFSFLKSTFLFLNIILFSLLLFLAAASRANFKLWKAQFATNFWKILILIALISIPFLGINFIFLICFLIAIILSFFFKGYFSKNETLELLNLKEARVMGLAYLLYSFTLSLSIYSEQFFINLKGDVICSNHLFQYFAIFTPIALSLNGFLGFYYGPKFRIENNMNLNKFNNFTLRIGFFSIIITIVSVVIGLIFVKYFANKDFFEIDYYMILTLSLICVVRGFYTISSVCLGVFASTSIVKKNALLNWTYFIIYSVLVFTVLNLNNGEKAARLVALLSLCHWSFRVITAHFYTVKVVKTIQ